MRSNSTLAAFIFTRDITYNPEKLTIYARITIDGRRAEMSLKRYTSVNVWDIYKGRFLPIYSNQMINRTLKDIADACGIRIKLTFHVARHPFATAITLSNGVPIETVSKLLRHSK